MPFNILMLYPRYSGISKLKGLVIPSITSTALPVSLLSAKPANVGLILLLLKASKPIVSNVLST